MATKRKKPTKTKREPEAVLSKAEKREFDAVKKWEETRKMGKNKYIVIKGTLLWSLMTTGIFVLLTLITNKFSVNKEILMYFLKMFVAFIGMGTVFGFVSWIISEKKYSDYQNKK